MAGLTFSIHYWIVFLETDQFAFYAPVYFHFQYPLLDRISWNRMTRHAWAWNSMPFSIHYWIVFLETWWFCTSPIDEAALSVSTIGSYFLKLRRHHNTGCSICTFSIHYWIVFLETEDRSLLFSRSSFFQYPLLDRISWNLAGSEADHAGVELSVSTIGSYFLKPHCVMCPSLPCGYFQYPLLDRISWNSPSTMNGMLIRILSVSTIGSYFLKP